MNERIKRLGVFGLAVLASLLFAHAAAGQECREPTAEDALGRIGAGTVGGALLGSLGGPVGVAVGAVVGGWKIGGPIASAHRARTTATATNCKAWATYNLAQQEDARRAAEIRRETDRMIEEHEATMASLRARTDSIRAHYNIGGDNR